MARWSELPAELLEMIDGHLGMYDDKIRFRCVCKHFRKLVSDLPDLRQQQQPWLLLPYKTGSMCGLYHPFENKVFDIDLPEAGDKVFLGTGHGWVVTQQLNGSIDVLNPLTRVRVQLPPRYEFPDVCNYDPDNIGQEYVIEYEIYPGSPDWYHASSMEARDSAMLEKVVLSSSPLSDDFIAVAVFALSRLAYCKAGDSEWRDLVDVADSRRGYHDVTFLGGILYAVSNGGELMICDDFRCSCPRLRKCDSVAVFPDEEGVGYDDTRITNSPDSLVMVRRKEEEEVLEPTIVYSTIGFEMYRLDVNPKTTTTCWIRIESLDDDESLFMGLGTQILFSSLDFIGKGNRIYFVSDHIEPNCGDIEDCFDNGIFDFKDGRFKPLGYECSPRVIWPSPIWFMPNPY